MLEYDNGLEDDFGLIHIQGSSNSLIANHISETIEQQYLKPAGVKTDNHSFGFRKRKLHCKQSYCGNYKN